MMNINKSLFFLAIVFIGCTSKHTDVPTDLFTLLTPEKTNITFSNVITEGIEMNSMEYEYFYNEGGVAVGNINNDGLADIYFTAHINKNTLDL